MATGSISQIKLPNGSTYDLKDTGLRSQTGVLSADGAGSVVGVDEVHFRPTVKYFDILTERTDLSVVKLSAEDYYNDVVDEKALSNVLYIVEDDKINAYGQQIKNVAEPTDLNDAATKEYVDTAVQGVQIPTDLSAFTNSPGYTTNVGTITGITMNGASKGTSGNVNLGTVLTAVPSAYKTYTDTKSSLSSDGYATQVQLDTIDDKIRYSLSSVSTSTSGTTQTLTLVDRANNSATQGSSIATVALAFQTATSGKARDFILALTCGSTPPNVAFPSGVTIVVDDQTDLTAEEGLNLYSFTEISAGTFVVSRLLVTAYSAQ